jgi:sodium transport system ATP-binding protein
MITARHLSKVFHDHKRGDIRALDDVSFSCHPGKIFGLLGVNGAGKTTCLRLLATLLQPTSGTATVAEHSITTAAEQVRTRIGFLSSATALYDRLTAWEMVEYFGRLHGMNEELLQKRLAELFTVLDMNEMRDRRCSKLSTGMKQKVSIARTLVHDPPVMIFDEPTLGLDVLTARAVLEFIRQCGQRNKTVIFSTHVMSEVEKLCDTIAIIHQGKFLGEGTLSEWRERTGLRSLEDIFVQVVEAPR